MYEYIGDKICLNFIVLKLRHFRRPWRHAVIFYCSLVTLSVKGLFDSGFQPYIGSFLTLSIYIGVWTSKWLISMYNAIPSNRVFAILIVVVGARVFFFNFSFFWAGGGAPFLTLRLHNKLVNWISLYTSRDRMRVFIRYAWIKWRRRRVDEYSTKGVEGQLHGICIRRVPRRVFPWNRHQLSVKLRRMTD